MISSSSTCERCHVTPGRARCPVTFGTGRAACTNYMEPLAPSCGAYTGMSVDNPASRPAAIAQAVGERFGGRRAA